MIQSQQGPRFQRPKRSGLAVRLVTGLCFAVLSGCVTTEIRVVDMTPPESFVGEQAEELLLDVGIAVFEANVPEDYDERVEKLIQPEIRRAEANYMAYFAKNLLQSTGNWGAVRVIPRATDAVDLVITGKIIQSDGESLEIAAQAKDASGRLWFSKTYKTLASRYAYEKDMPANIDPFQAVYKNLANDLLSYRLTLTQEQIIEIRNIAEMRFAQSFAPDAFDQHLAYNEDNSYQIKRLPAADDPMLARVRKVREREYLFIDTLDEYFAAFHQNMYLPYNTWRRSTYDEAIAIRQLRAEARARVIGGTAAIIGGIAAIYESNNAYVDAGGVTTVMSGAVILKSALSKRQEAAVNADILQELGVGAEAEIIPHTLELENQTLRLQGTVEEQYTQLRKILRQVYFEDLDLPVPPTQDADVMPVDEQSKDATNIEPTTSWFRGPFVIQYC